MSFITSGGSIVIGGFTNGVAGQVLRVFKTVEANSVTLEHNESTGDEKCINPHAVDLVFTNGSYGGLTMLRSDNGYWYVIEY